MEHAMRPMLAESFSPSLDPSLPVDDRAKRFKFTPKWTPVPQEVRRFSEGKNRFSLDGPIGRRLLGWPRGIRLRRHHKLPQWQPQILSSGGTLQIVGECCLYAPPPLACELA